MKKQRIKPVPTHHAVAVAPESKPPRAVRKHWTPTELEGFTDAFVTQLRRLHIVSIPSVGDREGARFINECLHTAQDLAISPERRRPLLQRANLKPAFWSRAEKALAERISHEKEEKAKSAIVALPAPPPPPEKTLDDFPDEQVIANAAVRLFRLYKGNTLNTDDVQGIKRTVDEVKQYGDLFTEELDNLRKQLAEVQSSKASEARITGLPRVAILGCRMDQFEVIVKECKTSGILAEFRHYDQDRNPHQFSADWAVAMRFMPHAWEDHAKRAVPPGHYAFITGGVGSVVMKLEEWLKNGTKR